MESLSPLLKVFYFIMITVFDVFEQICRENQIPAPSGKDLSKAGQMVATHFRFFWGIMQKPEVIQQAGFTWSKEPGRTVLVIGYPDEFKGEMVKRIMLYLSQKEEKRNKIIEKPTDSPPKETSSEPRKRNRKQVPHFTGKPLLKK